MRNQFWIIILLIGCIGQSESRIVEKTPDMMETVQSRIEEQNRAESVSIGTRQEGDKQERRAWCRREDYRWLVRCQVSSKLPWLYPCAKKRSNSRSGGKKKEVVQR